MNKYQENNFNIILMGIQQFKFDIENLEADKERLVKIIDEQDKKKIEKLENELWEKNQENKI